jgi:protein CpxP
MIGSWKRAAVAGALCLGLAAVATAGAAQDRPPVPPAAGPHGPGQPGTMDHRKMFEAMRARHERMLHDVLSIKPDQETAFHAYLAALAPPPRDGDRDGRPGPGRERDRPPGQAPMTTPQRLDRMAARMAQRQARFQQMASATRTFYAVLSPEQRRAFDALPMMMAGERRGRMGGHGSMGGGLR